jgi:hypothetical protein
MINGYKFTREEIVILIQEKCERTGDGIYWTPSVSAYLCSKGLCEDKYCYPREDFLGKVYFTPLDFEYFLTKDRKNNYIYDTMKAIDRNFLNNNYDTFNLKLKDTVKPYLFNLEELLDNYINIRYAVFRVK